MCFSILLFGNKLSCLETCLFFVLIGERYFHCTYNSKLAFIFFHHVDDKIKLPLASIDAIEKSSVFLWRYFGFSLPLGLLLKISFSLFPSPLPLYSYLYLSLALYLHTNELIKELLKFPLWCLLVFGVLLSWLGFVRFLESVDRIFHHFKKFSNISSSNTISVHSFPSQSFLRIILRLIQSFRSLKNFFIMKNFNS